MRKIDLRFSYDNSFANRLQNTTILQQIVKCTCVTYLYADVKQNVMLCWHMKKLGRAMSKKKKCNMHNT